MRHDRAILDLGDNDCDQPGAGCHEGLRSLLFKHAHVFQARASVLLVNSPVFWLLAFSSATLRSLSVS